MGLSIPNITEVFYDKSQHLVIIDYIKIISMMLVVDYARPKFFINNLVYV